MDEQMLGQTASPLSFSPILHIFLTLFQEALHDCSNALSPFLFLTFTI